MERIRQHPQRSGYQVWLAIPAFVFLLTLAACSGGDSAPVAVPPPASNGTITGRVIASDGSGGIRNAAVEVGTVQTTSGADGSYSLSVPAGDRAVVHVQASGFAENFRIARVLAGQNTSLTVQLLKVGATQNVAVAAGGTVTAPNSSAQVIVPPNGLIARS